MIASASAVDPSKVTAKAYYHSTMKIGSDTMRIDANCVTNSDELAFHVSAALNVLVNDMPYRSKSWTDSFQRNLL